MNKNFQHKEIVTRGSDKLESFIRLMKQMGWTGDGGWDGNSEDCYYYINTDGGLDFDVNASLYRRVDNDEFIEWYSDMLAPIEEDKKDVIKVTREEFKKIYNVACPEWRYKLTDWCNLQTFNDKLEFTNEQIKLMIDASTNEQRPVVKEVFHEYAHKDIDLSNMSFNGEVFAKDGNVALISISIYDHKSFYLNTDYNWEMKTNTSGETFLIPTKK